MTALIAVACIYAGSDKTVADIVSCGKCGFDIGTVVRINVYGIVRSLALCGVDKLSDNMIAVRSARILCAYGYLLFGAFEPRADTSHINAYCLGNPHGNGCRAAVSDLFIDGNMNIDLAF